MFSWWNTSAVCHDTFCARSLVNENSTQFGTRGVGISPRPSLPGAMPGSPAGRTKSSAQNRINLTNTLTECLEVLAHRVRGGAIHWRKVLQTALHCPTLVFGIL